MSLTYIEMQTTLWGLNGLLCLLIKYWDHFVLVYDLVRRYRPEFVTDANGLLVPGLVCAQPLFSVLAALGLFVEVFLMSTDAHRASSWFTAHVGTLRYGYLSDK